MLKCFIYTTFKLKNPFNITLSIFLTHIFLFLYFFIYVSHSPEKQHIFHRCLGHTIFAVPQPACRSVSQRQEIDSMLLKFFQMLAPLQHLFLFTLWDFTWLGSCCSIWLRVYTCYMWKGPSAVKLFYPNLSENFNPIP